MDNRTFYFRPRREPFTHKQPIIHQQYDDGEEHAWHARAITSTIIVIVIVVAIVVGIIWWFKFRHNTTTTVIDTPPTQNGTVLKASGGKCSCDSDCRDGLTCVDGICCNSREAMQLRATKPLVSKPKESPPLKMEQLTPTITVTQPINPSPTEEFTITIEQRQPNEYMDRNSAPRVDEAIRKANENGIMERMRHGSAVSDADMDFSY